MTGQFRVKAAGGALLVSLWAGGAMAAEDCAPADGARFVCGVNNVEDLVLLPGGNTVIGSDLSGHGHQGHFWLFDVTGSVRAIDPSEIVIGSGDGDASCPGAPDWSIFEPHGLSFEPHGDGGRLIATNHGGRESLEIFEVAMKGDTPELTWTGCIPAPEDQWPDDLWVLPDGRMVVTSLWDPRDEGRFEKLMKGEPVGGLTTWSANEGWKVIPGTEGLSGPNGVVATPDGKDVYVAAWSGQQLVHIHMDETPAIETIDVGYPVDNLNWSADGKTILMGGITASVADAFACFVSDNVNCPELGLRIDRFDPVTGQITEVVAGGIYGQLGAATGGIEVGDEIWVGTFRGDRIAIFER
ncbi:SMP-30/gluconolactonase/LRE family protein [Lutimaribacter marinistellae]|uniref:SMP-30/gluconolactonase/LRE family protein n=1 Tax=Lutimaribacter marinistellae TaxID=1820329 RepID=A0ABV7TBY8_9RHOB